MSATPMSKAVRHLEAGEWQAAHEIVQKDGSTLGCWAHGIVHLLEGDLENAKYWYRRAHRPLPHGNTATAEIAALKDSLREDTVQKVALRKDTGRKDAVRKDAVRKGTQ